MNEHAISLKFEDLGRKINEASDDSREGSFIFPAAVSHMFFLVNHHQFALYVKFQHFMLDCPQFTVKRPSILLFHHLKSGFTMSMLM